MTNSANFNHSSTGNPQPDIPSVKKESRRTRQKSRRKNHNLDLGKPLEQILNLTNSLSEKLRGDIPEYENANKLFSRANYEKALQGYQKTIQQKPDFHTAWLKLGNTLEKLDRQLEALAAYDKAVILKPDECWGWLLRGKLLYQLQQYEQALASLDQSISINPNHYEAWYYQGATCDSLQQYPGAAIAYRKASQLETKSPLLWYNLGCALQKTQQYGPAIEAYDKAIRLNFGEAGSSNSTAKILINPPLLDTWLNRGICLKNVKRYDAAIASFNRALEQLQRYTDAVTCQPGSNAD